MLNLIYKKSTMKKSFITFIIFLISFTSICQNKKYCNQIKKRIDKFDKDTVYYTPTNGAKGWIYFKKFKENKNDKIFMYLSVFNKNLSNSEKGVDIILENGERISIPFELVKITSEVVSGAGGVGYLYKAFFKLEEEDIDLLISSPIVDYRINVFEGKAVKRYAEKFYPEYLKCLREL